MRTNRVEALTDGLLAIIITVMVFDLKIESGATLADLLAIWPLLTSFALSFVYVAIHWNNHHHLFAACKGLTARIMWANMHLLFWLSLIPFTTRWVGDHPGAQAPTAAYGAVLLASAIAYLILQRAILAQHDRDTPLRRALEADRKGPLSAFLYLAGIGLAFFWPPLAWIAYAAVACLWLVPDRRIETALTSENSP